MGKRLWLDDCRKMPSDYDLWAKTADEAIDMLQKHEIDHCSLDHDLADDHDKYGLSGYGEPPISRESFKEKTGYSVLLWMAENGKWPASVNVHTANPSGKADMMLFLERHAPEGTTYKYVPAWTTYAGQPEPV